MALEFIRRHHLLTAMMLLAFAALLYLIGFGTGALIIVIAAVAVELTGWVLVFNGAPAGRSGR